MTPSILAASLVLALGQSPESTDTQENPSASSFLQTRGSLLLADTDFGAPDSLTRFHVALDARTPEFPSGLRAEAGVSVFLLATGTQGISLADNASFLRLRYRPSSWAPDEGLALTALPVSSTRLYMGYENPVAWGRQPYRSPQPGGEPGLELSLSRRRWDAFVAAKSARVNNGLTLETERRLMLMAGAGVDVSPGFRAEVKVANVDRGPAPGAGGMGIESPIHARGVSGRLLWHHGVPVGSNVDLALYEGDPTFFERFFVPDVYPGGFGASVALEGSYVSQQLLDTASLDPGETRKESAHAAALVARFKWDLLRLHALAYYRTATFITVDMPGFPYDQAQAPETQLQSELSATVGVDYFLRDWGLTPGLLVRVTAPATLERIYPLSPGLPISPLVLRGPNQVSMLPAGEDRGLILTARATALWDLGEAVGVLAELFYTRDPNQTIFMEDETGVDRPVLTSPDLVGGNLLLQVRF
ncbi:hypothetical protein [Myxococcus sp. Y35]|uniref:hypothetical protein n=1 Tax=Pseudomyxococcus flavus TaxID=3115648 RepID=UPI003CF926E8